MGKVREALKAAGVAPSAETVSELLTMAAAAVKYGGTSRKNWLTACELAWDSQKRLYPDEEEAPLPEAKA